jgi:hypothetical protein
MDRLGVTVPASVRDVALQKDKYHDLVESLQAMLKSVTNAYCLLLTAYCCDCFLSLHCIALHCIACD